MPCIVDLKNRDTIFLSYRPPRSWIRANLIISLTIQVVLVSRHAESHTPERPTGRQTDKRTNSVNLLHMGHFRLNVRLNYYPMKHNKELNPVPHKAASNVMVIHSTNKMSAEMHVGLKIDFWVKCFQSLKNSKGNFFWGDLYQVWVEITRAQKTLARYKGFDNYRNNRFKIFFF